MNENKNIKTTLQETLEKFRNDSNWNTKNPNGTHRFDKEILWIEEMVNNYAEELKMTPDEVISIMESFRNYSWPNYYQPANFPMLQKGFKDMLIGKGVYKTIEDFRRYAKRYYQGFKCPACHNIGSHPSVCQHRIDFEEMSPEEQKKIKKPKCDWCADGLFTGPKRVIILEHGLKAIPVFEPVKRSNQKKEVSPC